MRRLPILISLSLLLGGCGLIKQQSAGPATLLVTRDFGTVEVRTGSARLPAKGQAADAALRSVVPISLARDGKLAGVGGINAPSGSAWTLFVNGIAVDRPLAAVLITPGDHLWADLHTAANGYVPRGALGAFPEPFLHGILGKRLPTTLECAPDVTSACDTARRALGRIGIPGTYQLLGTGSGTETVGVIVGTERDLNAEVVAALLARGPGASGVFAEFGPGGRTLELLDGSGRRVRTLTGSAGLLAATGDVIAEPNWLITGTDRAGVAAAARAFARGPAFLRRRYALAVQGQTVIALPALSR